MSTGTGAPDERPALPEGYFAERGEGGRVSIHAAGTGAWVGEVDPNLSGARAVVEALIIAHEAAEAHGATPAGREDSDAPRALS